MNFRKFISGVSALAIAASAFAGMAVTASAAHASVPDGYTSYYSFDDNLNGNNNTAVELVGNSASTATDKTAAVYTTGYKNKAISFDGTYGLKLGSVITQSQWTASFDVKIDNFEHFKAGLFINQDPESHDKSENWISAPNGNWGGENDAMFNVWSRGGGDIWRNCAADANATTVGVWHNITITADGTKAVLYVDGVAYNYNNTSDINDTITALTNPASMTYLGVSEWADDAYNGLIDELYIYDGIALDATAVANLYKATKSIYGTYTTYGANGDIDALFSATTINSKYNYTLVNNGGFMPLDTTKDYVITFQAQGHGTGGSKGRMVLIDENGNSLVYSEKMDNVNSNESVCITINNTDETKPSTIVMTGGNGDTNVSTLPNAKVAKIAANASYVRIYPNVYIQDPSTETIPSRPVFRETNSVAPTITVYDSTGAEVADYSTLTVGDNYTFKAVKQGYRDYAAAFTASAGFQTQVFTMEEYTPGEITGTELSTRNNTKVVVSGSNVTDDTGITIDVQYYKTAAASHVYIKPISLENKALSFNINVPRASATETTAGGYIDFKSAEGERFAKLNIDSTTGNQNYNIEGSASSGDAAKTNTFGGTVSKNVVLYLEDNVLHTFINGKKVEDIAVSGTADSLGDIAIGQTGNGYKAYLSSLKVIDAPAAYQITGGGIDAYCINGYDISLGTASSGYWHDTTNNKYYTSNGTYPVSGAATLVDEAPEPGAEVTAVSYNQYKAEDTTANDEDLTAAKILVTVTGSINKLGLKYNDGSAWTDAKYVQNFEGLTNTTIVLGAIVPGMVELSTSSFDAVIN